jgi:hypothetical protein
MRISCDPDDQSYHPGSGRFIAMLNGSAVPHAITADEELGLVHVVADDEGNTSVLFGRVTIERLH